MDASSVAETLGWNIDIARLNYQEKDYEAAYESLTTVLDLDPRNSEARELRALTAKHLKNRSNALQADAEFLVETEPHRPIPYILLIDDFLSRGRFSEALQLARTATFRVYHTDPELNKIKALYTKLQHTELNFLVELPAEVLCEIFALLPFKSRLNCIAVSKRWRNVLTTIPDLWNTIDFGKTYKQESIILALKNFSAWSNIRKLRIPICDRTLGVLMQHKLRCIRQLDISSNETPLDQLVFAMAMREVGHSWQEVSFTSTIRVRLFFAAAAHFCPNLKKITIVRYFVTPDREEAIERDILWELDDSLVPEGTVSLNTLLLERCILDSSIRKAIFTRCTALQELVLKQCSPMLSSQDVFQSMLILPTLQSLIIEQAERNDYYSNVFGVYPKDLCTLLAAKPPVALDLTRCTLYREALQKISSTMRLGIIKRYKMDFRMDNEEDRALLEKKSMSDPTNEDVLAEIEEEEARLFDEDDDDDYDDDTYYTEGYDMYDFFFTSAVFHEVDRMYYDYY